MNHTEMIKVLKALADPVRLAIVERLADQPEICACNLLEDFEITQPTLSFHMKKLIQSGLITARKEGTWVRYQVDALMLSSLKTLLDLSVKTQASIQACTNNTIKNI